MFSVNLTSTALQDEHFIKFVGLCLAKSSLPKAMIGFEIDVATALHLGSRITDIATALHRLGCPLVLDDFGLRTECSICCGCLPCATSNWHRKSRRRCGRTSSHRQPSPPWCRWRGHGMHTVAKRTETAAEQEWLTALGVDFIQSNALSPAIAIESLSKPQKPKN